MFFPCSATSFFPGGEFNHSFQRPCSGFYRTCVRANRGRGFELGTTTNLWFHHEVPQVPYRARGSVCVCVFISFSRGPMWFADGKHLCQAPKPSPAAVADQKSRLGARKLNRFPPPPPHPGTCRLLAASEPSQSSKVPSQGPGCGCRPDVGGAGRRSVFVPSLLPSWDGSGPPGWCHIAQRSIVVRMGGS